MKQAVRIADDVLAELRVRWEDCADVAGWLGLKGQGRRFFCPSCQGTGGKDPDLSTPAGGGWRCFKCGAHGGPFDLVMLSRGIGFPDAVAWLRSLAGTSPPPPPRPHQPQEEQGQGFDAQAAWRELACGDPEQAVEWLEQRGIPAALVESGFGLLSGPGLEALERHAPRESLPRGFLEEHLRSAIVTPLRSAETGAVGAIHVRAFDGERRTIGKLSDPDGAPRLYGFAGATLRAGVLVLVEGMADTLAGEALLLHDASAVVVGASSAHELVKVARWLAEKPQGPRVIVVRHLDGEGLERDGVGQQKAQEAVRILGARASHFMWPTFLRALDARGFDASASLAKGFDLADALKLARAAGVSFDGVRDALREAVGLKQQQTTGGRDGEQVW